MTMINGNDETWRELADIPADPPKMRDNCLQCRCQTLVYLFYIDILIKKVISIYSQFNLIMKLFIGDQ